MRIFTHRMFCKNFTISTNKSLEIQLDVLPEDNSTIFQCEFRVNKNTDHAGIGYYLYIYKIFYFHIQFYDHRHWNYEKKQWEK